MTDLTPTGRVILGMLSLGQQTGYDIKQFVDKSTRFFWAASYGQIYPELRRLEEAGLVAGSPEPSGGRSRTVYELTPDGLAALRTWLGSAATPLYELRDEGMLKLFFSDALPEQTAENLRAMRAVHERKLELLRTIEPAAAHGPDGPRLTLELGIRHSEFMIDWCASAQARVAEPEQQEV
jgi:DNA-binding PadR family transcriptional regulator